MTKTLFNFSCVGVGVGFLFENDELFLEKKNLNSEFESEYDLS